METCRHVWNPARRCQWCGLSMERFAAEQQVLNRAYADHRRRWRDEHPDSDPVDHGETEALL